MSSPWGTLPKECSVAELEEYGMALHKHLSMTVSISDELEEGKICPKTRAGGGNIACHVTWRDKAWMKSEEAAPSPTHVSCAKALVSGPPGCQIPRFLSNAFEGSPAPLDPLNHGTFNQLWATFE